MHRPYRPLLLAAAVVLTATGCATTSKPASENAENAQRVVQDAPLGSRIKKKSSIAPVAGGNREQMEQARRQQDITQAAIANDPSKATRQLR